MPGKATPAPRWRPPPKTPARNPGRSARAPSAPSNISVVINPAQYINPQQDAPLAFRSEALAARMPIHVAQRAGSLRPESVPHAIIARQVRTGFRRRNDVVAADGIIGRRQADLAHFAAELAQRRDARRDQVPGFARQLF